MKPSDFEQAKYLEVEIKKIKDLRECLMLRPDIDKKIIIKGQKHDGSTLALEFDIENSYGFFKDDLINLVEETYNRIKKEFEKYVKEKEE